MKKEKLLIKEKKSLECPYFEDCNVAIESKKSCLDYENCRTYKFKEKYKEYYNGDYLGKIEIFK